MSASKVAFIVLGVLAALAAAKVILMVLAEMAARSLERAGYCSFCFRCRGDYELRDGGSSPLNMCEACLTERWPPHIREHALKSGKIARVAK